MTGKRHLSPKLYHPAPDNSWQVLGTLPVKRIRQSRVARTIARRVQADRMQSTHPTPHTPHSNQFSAVLCGIASRLDASGKLIDAGRIDTELNKALRYDRKRNARSNHRPTNHKPNPSDLYLDWVQTNKEAVAYDKEADRVQAYVRNVAHSNIVAQLLIDSMPLRKDGKKRTRKTRPVKATSRRVESPLLIDRSTADIESAMGDVIGDYDQFIALARDTVPFSQLTAIGEPMAEMEGTE